MSMNSKMISIEEHLLQNIEQNEALDPFFYSLSKNLAIKHAKELNIDEEIIRKLFGSFPLI